MKHNLTFNITQFTGNLLVIITLPFYCLLFGMGVSCYAQGSIDHKFNPDDIGFGNGDGAKDLNYSTTLQPDGKIIIGGDFITYNGTRMDKIARLNPDGSLDSTFHPGTGATGTVYQITLQPDGKIFITGAFPVYNGIERKYIARLHPDGTLDHTFDPGMSTDSIIGSALLSDGKIIIVGNFTTYNGTPKNHIARLNADGTIDPTFNSVLGVNDDVFTANPQPDGKIIIRGKFPSYNGSDSVSLARLNTDGSLDLSFDPNSRGDLPIFTTTLQPDGKIIIGGRFTTYKGADIASIARLNTDGSLDTTFNPGLGANGSIYTSAYQPDGKIIIGGGFTSYNGKDINRIARLNVDGTLDTTFNPGSGANDLVNQITIQPNGQILVRGRFTTYNETGKGYFVRLNEDGSIDHTFNPGTGVVGHVLTTALQTDGKIIIGGEFSSYNGMSRRNIARMNTDGSLDSTFITGIGADSTVHSIKLQPDGKILIGGAFSFYNGTSANRIARLNPDGTLDTDFTLGSGASGSVQTITLQNDGKIIIAGGFTNYNGTSRRRIARINADGTLDDTFNSGDSPHAMILTTALQSDGKILIGGFFTSYNGVSINRIARLNSDGTLDENFNVGSGANEVVETIAIQPDGKIIIGGFFTNYNGEAITRIARLNPDGTLDTTFDPEMGASSKITTITLQPDGKIIIGGAFTTYNGTSRKHIARLNPDGSLDLTFDPGSGAGSNVLTTALQPDGKIIIGGRFTSYNGTGRNRIARILDCSNSTSNDVHTACETFTWIDGNTYTSSNNTAIYNFIGGAESGCDSLVTLNLTINSVDTSISVSGNTLTSNIIGAIYQWLDCDNGYAVIIGETDQIYTPDVSGNFAVEITHNNCTDTSSCYNVILTGIAEMNMDLKLIVYPNPFSSQATVWSEKALNNATLTIDNCIGQTVARINNIHGHTINLQRDNIAPGLIFLRLTQDNNLIATKKIIVSD